MQVCGYIGAFERSGAPRRHVRINMMYGDWMDGLHNQIVHYDFYFRHLPFENGFAVFAGLRRLLEYLEDLRFNEDDLTWLAERGEGYDPAFLAELRELRFGGDVYSVREGEVVFADEPLIRVRARALEAYLIEAALLNFCNFQTLIATKAARMVHAVRQISPDDLLLEFGTRRAHEEAAALWGARSSYIAGFNGTSNMKAGKLFGIPASGTMAHSFVQRRKDEQRAFRAFARAFPNHCVLLVDTYDTLESGVPNAIVVAKEMEDRGHRLKGIRIDSGDLTYLSVQARKMLDEAGLQYVAIVASNDLDEHIMADLKLQGAKVSVWGVGTKLVTAFDDPALGGVYKLVAQEEDGLTRPLIKISDNEEKITTPGVKQVWRLFDKASGQAQGDCVSLVDESIENLSSVELVHPLHDFKRKMVRNFKAEPLLYPAIRNGKGVWDPVPSADDVRTFHLQRMQRFDKAVRRRVNPHVYPVALSQQLASLRHEMIRGKSQRG